MSVADFIYKLYDIKFLIVFRKNMLNSCFYTITGCKNFFFVNPTQTMYIVLPQCYFCNVTFLQNIAFLENVKALCCKAG